MNLSEYQKNASYFSLGHLPTEGFHPETETLSDLVKTDLPAAIRLIQKIDLQAIASIRSAIPIIQQLRKDIQQTLQRGNRIYISGCGATGRLALTLESMWRKMHAHQPRENSVHAFMAGGDFALVKSVENFEDFPDYGIQHLEDQGFREGDLLIAITEGGETPYVIGTVLGALALSSSVSPWFVYCNPTEVLTTTIPRSKEVIEDPRVQSLCLPTGPMALSGSTRLQAATVQLFAVGMALFPREKPIPDAALIDFFCDQYQQLDLVTFLEPAIKWEAEMYRRSEFVMYRTESYPICVLTDTTERSPTFSLLPFETSLEQKSHYSWCYLSVPSASNSTEAWKAILHRHPRGLDWPALQGRLSTDSILQFDFSRNAKELRDQKIAPKIHHSISINEHPNLQQVELKTEAFTQMIKTPLIRNPLWEQILIKLFMNTSSLMVMGLLDRYDGNVMTWVRPSNGKLVDRSLRYLQQLLKRDGIDETVDRLAVRLFEVLPTLNADQSLIQTLRKEALQKRN